jgi:hypothetical protein
MGAIQAEGHSPERALVFDEPRIDTRKGASVAHEAKGAASVRRVLDDVAKVAVQRRLAAREAQMIDATRTRLTQHAADYLVRQIAGACMTIVKAVPASQIAAIR